MEIDKKQIKIFRALSDEQRMKLFYLVCSENRLCNLRYDNPPYSGNCVSGLKKKLRLSQSTISHHVKLLEDAGLIRREKIGKWEYFFPNLEPFDKFAEFSDLIKTSQKQSSQFFEAIEVTNPLGAIGFKELISLLSNHEYRSSYKTTRQNSLVAYLKDSVEASQNYVLVYNPETNVISVHIIAFDGKKPDIKLANTFTELIHKYLPTIKIE